MKNKQTIEHLYRLSNILKLHNLNNKDRDTRSRIANFVIILDKLIINIYKIYISYNIEKEIVILSIAESITIEDKRSLLTLLNSSRKYIQENKDELDEYNMNILLSKLSTLIYNLD